MIRAIAAVLMGSGALMFLGRWGSYANAPLILRESAAVAGMGVALLVAVQLAVPILKIAAGCGLFTLKRWAWSAALIVLGADVFTPGAEGGEIVRVASILPVYAVVGLSFVSLVVMCWKPVRKRRQDRQRAA